MNLYPGLLVKTTYAKGEVKTGEVKSVHLFSATIVHQGTDPEEKPQLSSHHYRWLEPIEK